MSIDERTPPEAAIWDHYQARVDGQDAHVAEHPDSGLRVVAAFLPANGVWSVEVHPPEESGDAPLYRVDGFQHSKAAAKETVLAEIKRCEDGSPRTFDDDRGVWRCEE